MNGGCSRSPRVARDLMEHDDDPCVREMSTGATHPPERHVEKIKLKPGSGSQGVTFKSGNSTNYSNMSQDNNHVFTVKLNLHIHKKLRMQNAINVKR